MIFTFTRDGQVFICAWHPHHDMTHPANANTSHGACDACLARELAALDAEETAA